MAWFQDIQDVPMLAGHSWDRTPAETPLGSIADPGCHPWQPWPAARDLAAVGRAKKREILMGVEWDLMKT